MLPTANCGGIRQIAEEVVESRRRSSNRGDCGRIPIDESCGDSGERKKREWEGKLGFENG
jgi:hypothetical protein